MVYIRHMKEKISYRNLIVIATLLLILLVVFSLLSVASSISYINVDSTGDVWDLRDFDFENYNAYLVSWIEVIPNALLTPEEYTGFVNDAVIIDNAGTLDYYTSRMRILVPDDGWYTFARKSADYSHRIYVNGEWMVDMGLPGESPETDIPDTGRILFKAKATNGVIELVQQSSNFVHREGDTHAHWYVGTGNALENEVRADDYFTSIIMGCFLILFLVFVLLFFMLRQNRALLYFALFCLMWFMRTGVTDGRIFTVLFPWMDWFIKFRIEYIAIPVSAVLTLAIIDSLFPKILQKTVLRILYIFSAVYLLLFLFAGTVFMSYALLGAYAVYGLTIIYIIVRFAMKLRKISMGQGIFLLGVALFFISAVGDATGYLGLVTITSFDVTKVSLLLFALCKATAVFIATMDEVELAKIRERRAVAENAALKKLSRMKTEFLQDIKHEIRNPLHVMSLRTDFIYMQLDTEYEKEDVRKALHVIQNEAIRLERMVNGMVELATMDGGQLVRKRADFAEMLRHCAERVRLLILQKWNVLHINIPSDLADVYAEIGQLERVSVNLLENANNNTTHGEITIEASVENDYIIVRISDTGDGIDPEILPRVFERGFSGKGGKGYGLSISKTIVEAHGGSIEIDSELHKGTTVTFTIPVYGGQGALGSPGEADSPGEFGRLVEIDGHDEVSEDQ